MTTTKQRTIIWLKHRMTRRNSDNLFKILVGVAKSHSASNKFAIIEHETGHKFIFRKNTEGNYQVMKYVIGQDGSNLHESILRDIKRSNYMVYLAGKKSNLNEKLTKDPELKIICIYVTASRKTFRGITGENVRRCLVNLREKTLDDKPLTDIEIEWKTR